MTQKQTEPDMSAVRAKRTRPTPAPTTPAPGSIPATTSTPAPGAPVRAPRAEPTVALNTRVAVEIRDAVAAAAQRPETPSQRAVIEALVRQHLMGQQ